MWVKGKEEEECDVNYLLQNQPRHRTYCVEEYVELTLLKGTYKHKGYLLKAFLGKLKCENKWRTRNNYLVPKNFI